MVTNITLVRWNSVKCQIKIVFQVRFAANQVTSGVKSFKETSTHQVEAVWVLPRTFFKNKNCTKTPQTFTNMPTFKKESNPEMQAPPRQDSLRKRVPSLFGSWTWVWSSGASACAPALLRITSRCAVLGMTLSGTTAEIHLMTHSLGKYYTACLHSKRKTPSF